MKPLPLTEQLEECLFGGKAASLAVATRAGLPVPVGVALPFGFVDSGRGGRRRGKTAASCQISYTRCPARGPLVRGR